MNINGLYQFSQNDCTETLDLSTLAVKNNINSIYCISEDQSFLTSFNPLCALNSLTHVAPNKQFFVISNTYPYTIACPVASPTPTPSITPTPTLTPSSTKTPTPTPTNTPSQTQTPTVTPSITISPTVTLTITQTPSVTPTKTATPSPTITPTLTPTNTPSLPAVQCTGYTYNLTLPPGGGTSIVQGVTLYSDAYSGKFSFNNIDPTGSPATMFVNFNGTLYYIVDFASGRSGQPFCFVPQGGTQTYTGNFTDGDIFFP